MSDIIKSEDAILNLSNNPINDVSPYDATYPLVLLSNAIKNKMVQAESIACDIYKTIIKEAPTIIQAQQSTKKGVRYVVDMADTTLNAIESGKIKFTSEKGGKIFAQLRETNGQYGKKVPIKREAFRKGIDPVQMLNSLQLKALQEQMQSIAEQINLIDNSVKSVLQGQQNDRISAYYSGLALYLESTKIENRELKHALMAQALRALTDSTFQLTITMQSDIKYLTNKEYSTAKGKRVEIIDERMKSINQSFAFIHQATMLRAGIYCSGGEMSAMAAVLNEYSYFIENTVAKNANLLAQCDMTDSGTISGVWNSRAKLSLDVADFSHKLSSPDKTIYLGFTQEDE